MKIGLAAYEFINGDMEHNIAQVEKGLKLAHGRVDLLCFGEAFLQGFDSLCWEYEADRQTAVSVDSEAMGKLCDLSRRYQTDLLIGYMEKSGEALYSSCAVIVEGKLAHNYRRVSKGWKDYTMTDGHYQEGNETVGFCYRGRTVQIALCGDLWDFPERFKTSGLLIWPIYVNFSEEDWAQQEPEYARQAQLAARQTLMVNSLSHDPDSCGGAFWFVDGKTESKLDFNKEEILIVEV